MKTFVVIAEEEELKLVKQLGYEKETIFFTGVGALNVIESLKDLPKDDIQIINIGYAGSKDLKPGKFYCVDKSTLYHPNVDYHESVYEIGWVPWPKGLNNEVGLLPKTCYTGCDFVLSSDKTDCLFDMELAYILALGFKNVISFKYVSDNLDLQQYREEAKNEK